LTVPWPLPPPPSGFVRPTDHHDRRQKDGKPLFAQIAKGINIPNFYSAAHRRRNNYGNWMAGRHLNRRSLLKLMSKTSQKVICAWHKPNRLFHILSA
jgi:hypothetical protein